MMAGLRRVILQCALLVIVLLIGLSIYGAFQGAAAARLFFNSIPVGVYWAFFLILLVLSIAVFPRLLKVPSLLLLHAGCVCILLGGLYGSEPITRWMDQFRTEGASIRSGRMMIYEQETDNRVLLASDAVSFGKNEAGRFGIFEEGKSEPTLLEDSDPRIGKLPFALRLTDFRITHYPGELVIRDPDQRIWRISARKGFETRLGPRGTVTILEVYRNLKLASENGQMVPFDQGGSDDNPAVRVQFRYPDGTEEKRFVFANSPGHSRPDDPWTLQYIPVGMIQDYFSDLEVVKDGQIMERKTIEVNHPLYYGGYFFYQSSYDAEQGLFTILQVTSDRGLIPVFLGFALVVVGSFWHFWIPRRGRA